MLKYDNEKLHNCLKIKLSILYFFDVHNNYRVTIKYNNNNTLPSINVLIRPGHYDILIMKDNEGIRNGNYSTLIDYLRITFQNSIAYEDVSTENFAEYIFPVNIRNFREQQVAQALGAKERKHNSSKITLENAIAMIDLSNSASIQELIQIINVTDKNRIELYEHYKSRLEPNAHPQASSKQPEKKRSTLS
jgi:hypothetical protein